MTLDSEQLRERVARLTTYFMAHGVSDKAASNRQAVVALGNLARLQPLIMGFSDTFAIIGSVLVLAMICVSLTEEKPWCNTTCSVGQKLLS